MGHAQGNLTRFVNAPKCVADSAARKTCSYHITRLLEQSLPAKKEGTEGKKAQTAESPHSVATGKRSTVTCTLETLEKAQNSEKRRAPVLETLKQSTDSTTVL